MVMDSYEHSQIGHGKEEERGEEWRNQTLLENEPAFRISIIRIVYSTAPSFYFHSSTSNVTFFSITRNFVVSPVSRHFLYSVTSPRDFGVSPVSRTLFDMT